MVATPMRGAAHAMIGASSISTSSARTTPPTLRSGLAMHAHVEGVHAACVGTGDAEHESIECQFLARFGQVPDRGRDQATDGVVFVVVEIRAETLVEVRDR